MDYFRLGGAQEAFVLLGGADAFNLNVLKVLLTLDWEN